MTSADPGLAGLARLEADLARDLQRLNHPPANWVPERPGPDGQPMCDVLIVGAGMCGLTASFALKRLGMSRQRVIDRASAGSEGPWLTFARMERLRSPKHITGPAMGLPNLTFRAWYEAQHGLSAWEPLGRIPRPMWAEYLGWYARVTGAAVENGVTLDRVEPADGGVAVRLVHGDGRAETVHTRKLVLATGRESPGQARIPAALRGEYGRGVSHSSASPQAWLQSSSLMMEDRPADYAARGRIGLSRHGKRLWRRTLPAGSGSRGAWRPCRAGP